MRELILTCSQLVSVALAKDVVGEHYDLRSDG